MEKFSLKWNDFEANASKSFRKLRMEENFFDVTLVSDDEQEVSAHKLVLSASSEFFKKILKNSTHFNPLIYLPGVESTDLNLIIDYIYNGEIQLYQDHLDNFLDIAQKLKIEGLIRRQNDQKHQSEDFAKNDEVDINESSDSKFVKSEGLETITIKTKYEEYTKAVSLVEQDYSKEELAKIVDDLFFKNNNVFICKSCGKTTNRVGDMRKHVEIHIEGLSFPCAVCENTFRSRNILQKHLQRVHRKCQEHYL